jgi:hypothetical protein
MLIHEFALRVEGIAVRKCGEEPVALTPIDRRMSGHRD